MDSSSSGDRGRLLQVPYNHQDLIRILLVGMREGMRVQFGGQPDEWPAEAPAPRKVIDARHHPAWPGELDDWADDEPRERRPLWPRMLAVVVVVALLMSMTGWLLFSSGLLPM